MADRLRVVRGFRRGTVYIPTADFVETHTVPAKTPLTLHKTVMKNERRTTTIIYAAAVGEAP